MSKMLFIAGVFAALLIVGNADVSAQSDPFQFDITSVATSESHGMRLREASAMLENDLIARGGERNEKEGWLFLVGLSEEDERQQVALSITVLHKLPEEVVALGKKEQVFYKTIADQDPATHPEEGKWVREYMSEEFLRQFAMVQGNYVEITDKARMNDAIVFIVDKFSEQLALMR
ncbi:MAG: hypothetical protein AB8G77_01390 [Rhodothermales bacterium]